MELDPFLLEILVCPEDKTPLKVADQTLVAKLNQMVANRTLFNRGKKSVTEWIDGGLIRSDGKFLYPVRKNIPIMLIDEGIPLDSIK